MTILGTMERISCSSCNHKKGECGCLCCVPISKLGCPSCIIPVLAYRGIKKLIRKANR